MKALLIRSVLVFLGIGIGLATAVVLSPRLCRFLAIDDCLDRGGAWNYEYRFCEGLGCLERGGIWNHERRFCEGGLGSK